MTGLAEIMIPSAETGKRGPWEECLFAGGEEPDLLALLETFVPVRNSRAQASGYICFGNQVLKEVPKMRFQELGWPCTVSAVRNWMSPFRVQIHFPEKIDGEELPRLYGGLTKDVRVHFELYLKKLAEKLSWPIELKHWYYHNHVNSYKQVSVCLRNETAKISGEYPRLYSALAGYVFVLGREAFRNERGEG